MKRIFAILALFIFLFSAAGETLAEELPIRFLNALSEKAAKFDLQKNDYQAVLTAEGVPFYGTLRQNGTITEINLSEIVKLQLDGRSIVLQLPGQTYLLNLDDWMREFQNGRFSGKEMEADRNALISVLQRFTVQVLLPFVEIQQNSSGFSLHVSADLDALYTRLYTFIDAELQKDDLCRLFERYQDLLKTFIPDCPDSFDQLAEMWNQSREYLLYNRVDLSKVFALDLDLSLTTGFSSVRQLVCYGNVTVNNYVYGFNLEYQKTDNGCYVMADVNARYQKENPVSIFRLDIRDSTLHAEAVDPGSGYRYFLDLAGKDYAVTGSVRGTEWNGQMLWEYELSLSKEPETGDVLLSVAPLNGSVPLYINGRFGTRDMSVTVKSYNDTVEFRCGRGSEYLHASLKITPAYSGGSSAEFWLYRQVNGEYRFMLDGSLNPANIFITLKGIAGPSRAELEYQGNLGYYPLEAALRLAFGEGDFDLNAEYQPITSGRYAAKYRNNKTEVRLKKTGEEYTVEFAYPYNRWTVQGNGTIRMKGWILSSAVGQVVTSYNGRADLQETQRMIYSPGKLTLMLNDGIYSLDKTNDSAELLSYVLSRNGKKLYELICEWTEEEAGLKFLASLSQSDQPLGGIVIQPVPKTEIHPISRDGAIQINPEFLMETIHHLIR